METNKLDKLKILHIGADPEFNSQIIFQNFMVQINTADNPFTACQWISDNGLPDAVICEESYPGEKGFGFHDFWIEQFDAHQTIPFILLGGENNQEVIAKAVQKKNDDIFPKSTDIEIIVNKILEFKKNKVQNNKEIVSKASSNNAYETPFFKRTFDIIAASVGLLVVSPLLLIVIIAIRLESKGKVWSVLKKVGTGYKVFDYYRLRSTIALSDNRLKGLAHLKHPKKEVPADNTDQSMNKAQQARQQASITAKSEEDPLITKVGHIILKTGIDGLPVLFNILKGDMSMVGNKPLPIYEAELLSTDDLSNRMNGPAGITGFWKIKSRKRLKKMSPEDRRALENKYSKIAKKKLSFWKDLWIITRTFPAIFRKENV